ncbi:MAG: hypothetical protein HC800_05375 [Phormidesmis sp. RL_2_1]|nr:hypothetical protein [Phormidesmis sp. RL_2_1]
MTQLILYSCPVGPLATQIATYFEKSQRRYGKNAAHAYMPHCTLTGFFADEEAAIAQYLMTLDTVLSEFRQPLQAPLLQAPLQAPLQRAEADLSVIIQQLAFKEDWHGLVLKPRLKADGGRFCSAGRFAHSAAASAAQRLAAFELGLRL